MPSRNQYNDSDQDYDPWERAFMDSGGIDPAPLLRGIDSLERALKAHRKAHEYDARKKHKRYIAKQIENYRED